MSSPAAASPAPETASTPSAEAPKQSISWAERARQNIPADAETPSHIKSVPAPPSDNEEEAAPAPAPKAPRNRNPKNKNAEKTPANDKPRNPRQNTDGKRPARGGKGGAEKGAKKEGKKEGNAAAEGGSTVEGETAAGGEKEKVESTPAPPKKKSVGPPPAVNPWKISSSPKPKEAPVDSASSSSAAPVSEPSTATPPAPTQKSNGKKPASTLKDESSWPEPSLAVETKEEPVKEKKAEETKEEETKDDEEKSEKKKGSNKKGKKNWVPISPAEMQASVDQAAERSRKNAPKPKRDGETSTPAGVRPAAKGRKPLTSTPAAGAASTNPPSAPGTGKKAIKKAAAAERKEKESGGAAAKETVKVDGESSTAEASKEGASQAKAEHVEAGPDGLREGASSFVPETPAETKPIATQKGGAGGGRGRGGSFNHRNSSSRPHPQHAHQAIVDPSQGHYLPANSAAPIPLGGFPPLHHVPGVGSFPIGGFIPPNPPVAPTRAPPANPANSNPNRVYYPPPLPMPVTLPNFPLDSLRFYVLGQLEHYFSAQNLAMDFFLRQQMDSLGFVLIPLLATFNRVKQLTEDLEIVKETLAISQYLEVRGDKVRLAFGAWQQWVLPTAPQSEEVDILPISTEEEEAALNDYTPIPSRADTPSSE